MIKNNSTKQNNTHSNKQRHYFDNNPIVKDTNKLFNCKPGTNSMHTLHLSNNIQTYQSNQIDETLNLSNESD